jgi:mevalonate kinase
MKISYSAPAKIIISGEHSAVYYKPALISAVGFRLTFTVKDGTNKSNDNRVLEVSKKVKIWLKRKNIPYHDKTFDFKVSSQIPRSGGFGSSSALSVAAAATFLEFFTDGKENFRKEEINEVAYECEKIFHGNPSGMDNATSCFGGLIFYRKEFEFLKTASSLPFLIPKKFQNNLFILSTGNRSETTLDLVSNLAERTKQNPAKYKKIYNDIEKTTKKITESIERAELNQFLKLLAKNQSFLTKLGVVSYKTSSFLKDLQSFGFGKISGAGGVKNGSGYALFCTYPDKQKAFEDHLKKEKIEFYRFIQDGEGVRREEN